MINIKLKNFIKDLLNNADGGILFILWVILIIPILLVASIAYFIISVYDIAHSILLKILNDIEWGY